jgi:hypothetical protein
MNNQEEQESEYYSIIELVETMSFKKLLLIIFGFCTFVITIAMSFVYWYLGQYHK